MPTLAEQVAALEAKLDHMRKKYEDCRADLHVAESRLASARVEGAREQQAAWVAGVRWMCEKFAEAPEVVRAGFTPEKGDVVFYCGERIENIAAEKYPAPAAPAGEQTRPAPTPEPEPLVVEVKVVTDTGTTIAGGQLVHESRSRITLTPEDCRRIVALGSRPTQTAEG